MAMEDYDSETESHAAYRIAELKRCIRERDRTIIKLMKRAESLTNQEEEEEEDVDEVEEKLRSLKMGQENVKNLLKELLNESGLGIDGLQKMIKEIEEEEDHLKNRLTNLMIKINGEDYKKGGEDYEIEEEDSVEAIKKGGIEVIVVKIAQLLASVCCCFITRASKKRQDPVPVNEQVEAINKESIEVGVKISGLFVDVMIMLSERNVLRRMEFQGFKNSLESDSDEKAPAINKFVAVIRIVEGTLRSMKIPDLPESSSVPEISDLDGSRIGKILDKVQTEILHLNLLMMDCSKSDLTEADVFSMKNDLKKCEKNSKIIEMEVKKYWAGYYSLLFEPQELEDLKKEMEGKISEIWKGESEEKE